MTNPELELAKDQLWKFQLRREHAQLLKNIDMQKEAFMAFAEEAKATQDSFREELTTLKSRFEKLAGDNERYAQEAKAQRRAVEDQVAEIENIKNDIIARGVHVRVLEGREKAFEDLTANTPNTGIEAHATTPTTMISTASPIYPSPVVNITATTTTKSTSNTIPATPHNFANRKSRRQARQAPSPLKPPSSTYASLPDPPIQQESRSLAEYFVTVDKISKRLDPTQSTGLVAMFVTGLAAREHQDRIVERLEEKGMARMRSGSKQVEMMCQWGDLKVVLRALGLVVAVSHKKGMGKKSRAENERK